MLKSFIVICLVILTTYSGKANELPELSFKYRVAYEKGVDAPFTGKGKFVSKLGDICVITIGTYEKGLRKGLFTDESCDGVLMHRGYYDDKKWVGHHEEWNRKTKKKVSDLVYNENGELASGWYYETKNGNVVADLIYKDGKETGYRKPQSNYYNPHNCKEQQYEYFQNNTFVDCRKYKAIHKPQVKKEVDDTFSGIKKEYWDNGNIKFERKYVKGRREGITKSYYKTSELYAEIPYKDGLQEGVAIGYFPSGKIKFKEHYKNGRREGDRKDYYENGSPRADSSYTNDKLDYSRIYFSNGKLQDEQNFLYGKQNGIQRRYYKNGQIKWEHFFKNGMPKWFKKYDENGDIISEQ